jgi:hypothetical protein
MPPTEICQNEEILPHAIELRFTGSKDGSRPFLRDFDAE